MATLEEVLAALNSATTNAREVLTKIPQIATSSNDVSFTFADGTQITLPGLQKLKAEVDGFITNGLNNALEKWNICIHEQEGSDEKGDGTLDKPFRSLKKALSLVPNGGVLGIKLLSDVTLKASEAISIQNKSIIVTCYEEPRTLKLLIDAKSPCIWLNCQALFRIRANISVENQIDDLKRPAIVANSHLSEVQIERIEEIDQDFSLDIGDNCRLGNFSILEFTDNVSGNINLGNNASIGSFYRGGIFRWRDNITINGSTDYNLSDFVEGIIRDSNGKVINLLCNKEL